MLVEFEKDDDINYYIDFLIVCSNFRVENYKIELVDRYKIKFIVGKIILVIVIIMVFVMGLVVLEFYKVIDGKDDLE